MSGSPPAHPRRRRDGSRRGFTLLELLIALGILTVIAAISMWAYFTRPEVTLDNAAQLLARDMRIAQNRAMMLHHPVHLVFAPDGDGYRIVDGEGDRTGERSSFERVERCYSRDAVFEGVKVLPCGLAAEGRLLFPSDGRELPPGRIVLSYRDETRTLEIQGRTGKILLSDRLPDRGGEQADR